MRIMVIRTMIMNAEMDGAQWSKKKDIRITKVGKFIRKVRIDELPQIWNVLKGEMSLVGPRPALPHEVAAYNSDERERLNVLPGLTCFWQIRGRADLSFRRQVALDLLYIEECSMATDLRVLVQTIPAVLSGRGAY